MFILENTIELANHFSGKQKEQSGQVADLFIHVILFG